MQLWPLLTSHLSGPLVGWHLSPGSASFPFCVLHTVELGFQALGSTRRTKGAKKRLTCCWRAYLRFPTPPQIGCTQGPWIFPPSLCPFLSTHLCLSLFPFSTFLIWVHLYRHLCVWYVHAHMCRYMQRLEVAFLNHYLFFFKKNYMH